MPDDITSRISDALDETVAPEIVTPEATAPVAPEKIKIGDTEYSMDEASALISLGKIGKEAEEKFNTKIDRVWPEFTKAQNDKRDLQAKLDDLNSKMSTAQTQVATGEITLDEATKQAREAAKKLGIVLDDDLPNMMQSKFREFYIQERAAEKLLDEADSLQTEYDGTDGRPPFKTEEILKYMAETGIRNPEKAYKDKYETEIDSWKEKQISGSRKPGLTTETASTAGSKKPDEIRVTRDNLNKLVSEALEG